ncbi:MAG: ISAs1 family transposase, partial [Mariprofundaceae bacterium]|nr:ISAs1 family transposase [Mariprofundaceae bacterium]
MTNIRTNPKPVILDYFSEVPDPRIDRRKLHSLEDIFFITLCAVICGANDWVSIVSFGRAKEEWFKEVFGLENGIPSHDTFGNVFNVIDTEIFATCFSQWASDLISHKGGDIISLDGKCLRGSLDLASGKSAIYMVSAWASKNELVLGQQRVDEKSNEITAIPKLLSQLEISGSVI